MIGAVALRVVLIIVFFFQFMLQFTRPLLTLYASELGASTMEIGILTAAYAFFPMLIAISAGKIADRIGDRIPILFGMIFGSVGLAVPFLFHSMWALYVSQIIVGMAHIFVVISLQNVLGHTTTSENRDHYFGIFSMVVSISQFMGPVAGGYFAEFTSYAHSFLIAAILGCLPIAAAYWIPVVLGSKAAATPSSRGGSLPLLKSPLLRKALVGSALVVYSRDIFIAYFPLFATRLDISDSNIGWIIALQGLAMVPVRLYLGRMSRWFGRERLLVASILLAGVSFLFIPVTSSVPLLMVLAVLMGAGLGLGQPISMTVIYNVSPKSKTGEVLGMRLMTNRVSQLTAPILFGIIGSGVGLISVFLLSGVLLIGGGLYTNSRTKEEAY